MIVALSAPDVDGNTRPADGIDDNGNTILLSQFFNKHGERRLQQRSLFWSLMDPDTSIRNPG